MIELSNEDIAFGKAFRKVVTNEGIIPAIRDANLTRQSGNLGRRVIKLCEELGEHAEAYLNISSAGNGKGKTWDDVREEAADILIVAVDVALTPGDGENPSIAEGYVSRLVAAHDFRIPDQPFAGRLNPKSADYEKLTLLVGSIIGNVCAAQMATIGRGGLSGGRGVSGVVRAQSASLISWSLMLSLTPLPDQADWTIEQLEDQLVNTISVKLAKWRKNRDTGTAATDAE